MTEYRTEKSQVLNKLKFIIILKAPKGFYSVRSYLETDEQGKGEIRRQEDGALLIDIGEKAEQPNHPPASVSPITEKKLATRKSGTNLSS